MDLRHTVDRIQSLVSAETGRRLGSNAEDTLSQLLRTAANDPPPREDRFTSRQLTILFADLRGFMAISNRYPPETVLQVLNRCLVTMIDVVFAHEGMIDKFMGDSIMAHFSESASGKPPEQRAVLCALELQLAMDALNAARIEARSLRGQVLLSETTYQGCSALAKTGEPFSVHVKGKAEPIVVREL